MGKKTNIKVGGMVYTTKNSAWGLVPMKVLDLNEHGARCEHPSFQIGWFPFDELERITLTRKEQLKDFVNDKKRLDKSALTLFGKYGAWQ